MNFGHIMTQKLGFLGDGPTTYFHCDKTQIMDRAKIGLKMLTMAMCEKSVSFVSLALLILE